MDSGQYEQKLGKKAFAEAFSKEQYDKLADITSGGKNNTVTTKSKDASGQNPNADRSPDEYNWDASPIAQYKQEKIDEYTKTHPDYVYGQEQQSETQEPISLVDTQNQLTEQSWKKFQNSENYEPFTDAEEKIRLNTLKAQELAAASRDTAFQNAEITFDNTTNKAVLGNMDYQYNSPEASLVNRSGKPAWMSDLGWREYLRRNDPNKMKGDYAIGKGLSQKKAFDSLLNADLDRDTARQRANLAYDDAMRKIAINEKYQFIELERQKEKVKRKLDKYIGMELVGSVISSEVLKDALTDNPYDGTFTSDISQQLIDVITAIPDELIGAIPNAAIGWDPKPFRNLAKALGWRNEFDYEAPTKLRHPKVSGWMYSLKNEKLEYLVDGLGSVAGFAVGRGMTWLGKKGIQKGLGLKTAEELELAKKAKEAQKLSKKLDELGTAAAASGGRHSAFLLDWLSNVVNSKNFIIGAMIAGGAVAKTADFTRQQKELLGLPYKGILGGDSAAYFSNLPMGTIAAAADYGLMEGAFRVDKIIGNRLSKAATSAIEKGVTSGSSSKARIALGAIGRNTAAWAGASVVETLGEVGANLAELYAVYGLDPTEILSTLNSEDPADQEVKNIIIQSVMASFGAGVGIHGVNAFKETKAITNTITKIKDNINQKTQQLNSDIDVAVQEGRMTEEEAKAFKDFTKKNVEAAIFDKDIKAMQEELNNENTTDERKEELRKELQDAQSVSNAANFIANEIVNDAKGDGKSKEKLDKLRALKDKLDNKASKKGKTNKGKYDAVDFLQEARKDADLAPYANSLLDSIGKKIKTILGSKQTKKEETKDSEQDRTLKDKVVDTVSNVASKAKEKVSNIFTSKDKEQLDTAQPSLDIEQDSSIKSQENEASATADGTVTDFGVDDVSAGSSGRTKKQRVIESFNEQEREARRAAIRSIIDLFSSENLDALAENELSRHAFKMFLNTPNIINDSLENYAMQFAILGVQGAIQLYFKHKNKTTFTIEEIKKEFKRYKIKDFLNIESIVLEAISRPALSPIIAELGTTFTANSVAIDTLNNDVKKFQDKYKALLNAKNNDEKQKIFKELEELEKDIQNQIDIINNSLNDLHDTYISLEDGLAKKQLAFLLFKLNEQVSNAFNAVQNYSKSLQEIRNQLKANKQLMIEAVKNEANTEGSFIAYMKKILQDSLTGISNFFDSLLKDIYDALKNGNDIENIENILDELSTHIDSVLDSVNKYNSNIQTRLKQYEEGKENINNESAAIIEIRNFNNEMTKLTLTMDNIFDNLIRGQLLSKYFDMTDEGILNGLTNYLSEIIDQSRGKQDRISHMMPILFKFFTQSQLTNLYSIDTKDLPAVVAAFLKGNPARLPFIKELIKFLSFETLANLGQQTSSKNMNIPGFKVYDAQFISVAPPRIDDETETEVEKTETQIEQEKDIDSILTNNVFGNNWKNMSSVDKNAWMSIAVGAMAGGAKRVQDKKVEDIKDEKTKDMDISLSMAVFSATQSELRAAIEINNALASINEVDLENIEDDTTLDKLIEAETSASLRTALLNIGVTEDNLKSAVKSILKGYAKSKTHNIFTILKDIQDKESNLNSSIKIKSKGKRLTYVAVKDTEGSINLIQDIQSQKKKEEERKKSDKNARIYTHQQNADNAIIDFLNNRQMGVDTENIAYLKTYFNEDDLLESEELSVEEYNKLIAQANSGFLLKNTDEKSFVLDDFFYVPIYRLREIKDDKGNVVEYGRGEIQYYRKLKLTDKNKKLFGLDELDNMINIVGRTNLKTDDIAQVTGAMNDIAELLALSKEDDKLVFYYLWTAQDQTRQMIDGTLFNVQNNKLLRPFIKKIKENKVLNDTLNGFVQENGANKSISYTGKKLGAENLDDGDLIEIKTTIIDLVSDLWGIGAVIDKENNSVGYEIELDEDAREVFEINEDNIKDNVNNFVEKIIELLKSKDKNNIAKAYKMISFIATKHLNKTQNEMNLKDDDINNVFNAHKLKMFSDGEKHIFKPYSLKSHTDGSASGHTQKSIIVIRASSKAQEAFGQGRIIRGLKNYDKDGKKYVALFSKEEGKDKIGESNKERYTMSDVLDSLELDYPYGSFISKVAYNIDSLFDLNHSNLHSNIIIASLYNFVTNNKTMSKNEAKEYRTKLRDLAKTVATPAGFQKELSSFLSSISTSDLNKTLYWDALKTITNYINNYLKNEGDVVNIQVIVEDMRKESNHPYIRMLGNILSDAKGNTNLNNIRDILEKAFNNTSTINKANTILSLIDPATYKIVQGKNVKDSSNIKLKLDDNFISELHELKKELKFALDGLPVSHTNKKGFLLNILNGKKGKAVEYMKVFFNRTTIINSSDLDYGIIHDAMKDILGNIKVTQISGNAKNIALTKALQAADLLAYKIAAIQYFEGVLNQNIDKISSSDIKNKFRNCYSVADVDAAIIELANTKNDNSIVNDGEKIDIGVIKGTISYGRYKKFIEISNNLISQYHPSGLNLQKNNLSTEIRTKNKQFLSKILSTDYFPRITLSADFGSSQKVQTTPIDIFENIASRVMTLVEHPNEARTVVTTNADYTIYDAIQQSNRFKVENANKWQNNLKKEAGSETGNQLTALSQLNNYFNNFFNELSQENNIPFNPRNWYGKDGFEMIGEVILGLGVSLSNPNVNMKITGETLGKLNTLVNGDEVYGENLEDILNFVKDSNDNIIEINVRQGTPLGNMIDGIMNLLPQLDTIITEKIFELEDGLSHYEKRLTVMNKLIKEDEKALNAIQSSINFVHLKKQLLDMFKSLPIWLTDKSFAKEGAIISGDGMNIYDLNLDFISESDANDLFNDYEDLNVTPEQFKNRIENIKASMQVIPYIKMFKVSMTQKESNDIRARLENLNTANSVSMEDQINRNRFEKNKILTEYMRGKANYQQDNDVKVDDSAIYDHIEFNSIFNARYGYSNRELKPVMIYLISDKDNINNIEGESIQDKIMNLIKKDRNLSRHKSNIVFVYDGIQYRYKRNKINDEDNSIVESVEDVRHTSLESDEFAYVYSKNKDISTLETKTKTYIEKLKSSDTFVTFSKKDPSDGYSEKLDKSDQRKNYTKIHKENEQMSIEDAKKELYPNTYRYNTNAIENLKTEFDKAKNDKEKLREVYKKGLLLLSPRISGRNVVTSPKNMSFKFSDENSNDFVLFYNSIKEAVINIDIPGDLVNVRTGEVILTSEEKTNILQKHRLREYIPEEIEIVEQDNTQGQNQEQKQEQRENTNTKQNENTDSSIKSQFDNDASLNEYELEALRREKLTDALKNIEGQKKKSSDDIRAEYDENNRRISKIDKEAIASYIDSHENLHIDREVYTERLRQFVNNLGNTKIALLMRELLSKMFENLPDNVIVAVVSDSMLGGRNGAQFNHNNKRYVLVSANKYDDINSDTLAHELGHAIMGDAFKILQYRGADNQISKIAYIRDNMVRYFQRIKGTEQGNRILKSMGLITDKGQWTRVFEAITQGEHSLEEFAMYFAFNNARLTHLEQMQKDMIVEPRYDKDGNLTLKGNTLGILIDGAKNFLKELINIFSLGLVNFKTRTTFAEDLTSSIAQLSLYGDKERAKEIEETGLQYAMNLMNSAASSALTKLPILSGLTGKIEKYENYLKKDGKTNEDIDKIKNEIRGKILGLESKDKLSFVDKFMQVLKSMLWLTPLHREVAITMFNEYLENCNNSVAKGFSNLLKAFRIVGINNYTRNEKLIGEKAGLDKTINSNCNQVFEMLAEAERAGIGNEVYSKMLEASEDFELPKDYDATKDVYGLAKKSPLERFREAMSVFYVTGMSSTPYSVENRGKFRENFIKQVKLLMNGDENDAKEAIRENYREVKRNIVNILNFKGQRSLTTDDITDEAIEYFLENTFVLASQRLYGGSTAHGLQNVNSIFKQMNREAAKHRTLDKQGKVSFYDLYQSMDMVDTDTSQGFRDIERNKELEGTLYNMATLQAIQLIHQEEYSRDSDVNENMQLHLGRFKYYINYMRKVSKASGSVKDEFIQMALTFGSVYNRLQASSHIQNVVVPVEGKFAKYIKKEQELFAALRENKRDETKIRKLTEEVEQLSKEATITIKNDTFHTTSFKEDFSRDVYETFAINNDRKIVVLPNITDSFGSKVAEEYYKGLTRNGATTTFESTFRWMLKRGFKLVDNETNLAIERELTEREIKEAINGKETLALVYDGRDISNDITTAYILAGNSFDNKGTSLDDNLFISNQEYGRIIEKAKKLQTELQDKLFGLKAKETNSIDKSGIMQFTNIGFNSKEYRESVLHALTQSNKTYTPIAGSQYKLRTLMSRYHFKNLTQADTSMIGVITQMTRNNYKRQQEEQVNIEVINSIISDNLKMIETGKKDVMTKKWIKIFDSEYEFEKLDREERIEQSLTKNRMDKLAPNVLSQFRMLVNSYNEGASSGKQLKHLYVTEEMFELIQGVKTNSITGMFLEKLSNQKVINSVTSLAKNPKFAKGLQKLGTWVHEFINDSKVNIVIRNPQVLMSNAISQCLSLIGLGLSPSQIIGDMPIIYREIQRFERDSKDLYNLRTKLDSMMKNNNLEETENLKKAGELKRKIAILEESLKSNRVYFPMTYGADTNIMDETTQEDSLVGELYRKGYDKFADITGVYKVFKQMGLDNKTIRENVIMSQNSELYKFAVMVNRLSDLVPKIMAYEVYKREGYDNDTALNKAQTSLINYNTPLESGFLRLAERMGFLPFARFAVRVLPALFSNLGDKPVSTLLSLASGLLLETTASVVGLGSYVGMPIFAEAFSSLPNKLANPGEMVWKPDNLFRWGWLFD